MGPNIPLVGAVLVLCGALALSSACEYKISEPKGSILLISGVLQIIAGMVLCLVGGLS